MTFIIIIKKQGQQKDNITFSFSSSTLLLSRITSWKDPSFIVDGLHRRVRTANCDMDFIFSGSKNKTWTKDDLQIHRPSTVPEQELNIKQAVKKVYSNKVCT